MPAAFRRILLAVALLALHACASLPNEVVRLEEKDNGRTVELQTGQVLEILLWSLPGRGLTLSLGSHVEPTLVPEGMPTLHDDPVEIGVAGTGVHESWRFRARQPGQVTVRMDYRLQWEATGPPTRSVTFNVVVR